MTIPKRICFALFVGLSSIGLAGCTSGGSVAPQPPDLSGTWILNSAESEDPREQFEGQREPGDRQPRVIFAPTISAAIAASRVFKIEQADTTLTLSSAEGPKFTFYPDGREVVRPISGLGEVRTVSRWKGDRLIVERRLDGGATINTTYQLADEGKRLQVSTKISGIGRSIKFRRVYDAATAPP
jgi:hypothetical protein